MNDTRSHFAGASPLAGWDYWVLRFWRDAAAITLFIIAPVLQLAFFRWLPYAVLLSFCFIVIGHLMTGFRYVSSSAPGNYWHPRSWSRSVKFLAMSYVAFVLWTFASMFWSPAGFGPLKDFWLLIVSPPITLVLASELSKTTLLPFRKILMIGLALTALGLYLELTGRTTFFTLDDPTGHLQDINRSAVLLALLIWPMVFAVQNNKLLRALCLLVGGLCVYVIFRSWSESAQLMILVSLCVWIVLRVLPKLNIYLYLACAVVLIAFPLILQSLTLEFIGPNEGIWRRGSAYIRVMIWKGYADLTTRHPIVGLGFEANRAYRGADVVTKYIKNSDMNSDFGPKHTHNVALEFWTDFGAIGVVLFSLSLFWLGMSCLPLPPPFQAAISTIFIGVFSHSMTGASFFQGWWIASIVMAAIALIAVFNQSKHNEDLQQNTPV